MDGGLIKHDDAQVMYKCRVRDLRKFRAIFSIQQGDRAICQQHVLEQTVIKHFMIYPRLIPPFKSTEIWFNVN